MKKPTTLYTILGILIYLIALRLIFPHKDNSVLNYVVYFTFGTIGFYNWIKYIQEFTPSDFINKTFLLASVSTFLAFKLTSVLGL